ncbi:MAG: hypothetical protein A2Y63_03000 [Candidatus Riflebacteria bacterium RBG_13_59_9]|nr:MAG: hypothetical protein A2Y63_03000 [Candidatus Riflebacteria bacterium RBG_13_59_9]
MSRARELIEGLLYIAKECAKASPNGFTAIKFANETGIKVDIEEHNGWFHGTLLRRLCEDGFLKKKGKFYYLRKTK